MAMSNEQEQALLPTSGRFCIVGTMHKAFLPPLSPLPVRQILALVLPSPSWQAYQIPFLSEGKPVFNVE